MMRQRYETMVEKGEAMVLDIAGYDFYAYASSKEYTNKYNQIEALALTIKDLQQNPSYYFFHVGEPSRITINRVDYYQNSLHWENVGGGRYSFKYNSRKGKDGQFYDQTDGARKWYRETFEHATEETVQIHGNDLVEMAINARLNEYEAANERMIKNAQSAIEFIQEQKKVLGLVHTNEEAMKIDPQGQVLLF